jgi:hypothetical protein
MRVPRSLTLGLAGVFLVGCAREAISPAAVFPPPPVHETAAPPADRRLLPFLGSWNVRATVLPEPGGERRNLAGTARFVPANDGRSLRETLVLEGFRAATILGFSPERGRYELSQIDNATGGQVWMVGLWSADGRTLELEPAEPRQLEGLGFEGMRWTYRFNADGQLVKTIRVLGADELWRTQSTYVYSRP